MVHLLDGVPHHTQRRRRGAHRLNEHIPVGVRVRDGRDLAARQAAAEREGREGEEEEERAVGSARDSHDGADGSHLLRGESALVEQVHVFDLRPSKGRERRGEGGGGTPPAHPTL
jgi:hypothetical protein